MTLEERLERIESKLDQLVASTASKEFYSTAEVARMLGKAEFTVRTWCRLGRIKSQKRLSGRGRFPAWCVSQEELLRYQREGLLPVKGVQPVTGLSKERIGEGVQQCLRAGQESISFAHTGALPAPSRQI